MGSGILQDAIFITHRELQKVRDLQVAVTKDSLYSFWAAFCSIATFLEALVVLSGVWMWLSLLASIGLVVLSVIFNLGIEQPTKNCLIL
jgi:hypothetical protein